MKENPARRIKKVAPEQDETQPFTREQYDALIQATWLYDSRDGKKNGDTVNARRARTYLKLLRWSGLRAGDAACLSRDKLRDDDSLFLYQKKVKRKSKFRRLWLTAIRRGRGATQRAAQRLHTSELFLLEWSQ